MQKLLPYHRYKVTMDEIRGLQERVPDSEIAFAFMEQRAKQGWRGAYTNIELFLADLWNQCAEGSPSIFRDDWDRFQRALTTAPRP